MIIQPVQRIPRYELYIKVTNFFYFYLKKERIKNDMLKDFLKCTPTNHQDYQLLLKAQKEIHNLAEKIIKSNQ